MYDSAAQQIISRIDKSERAPRIHCLLNLTICGIITLTLVGALLFMLRDPDDVLPIYRSASFTLICFSLLLTRIALKANAQLKRYDTTEHIHKLVENYYKIETIDAQINILGDSIYIHNFVLKCKDKLKLALQQISQRDIVELYDETEYKEIVALIKSGIEWIDEYLKLK